jgi:ligand-binding sensor domain-containing protein/signal transduction histidine kinase/DNA-binding response OmpR family regulator
MILRIVIFTYSLLLSIAANSANYRFQHINSEQGLPHQQVETMVQDQKGNIWIGTRNGLAKYDGYDIFTYYHDENKTTSLRHNYIHTLYLDKKNRLWICTEIGVCLYRPATNDFKSYNSSKNLFWTIVENSKGDVFFGGNVLCKYDEKNDAFVQYPTLNNGGIKSMTVDKHDNLYVATNSSIFYFNSSMSKITPVDKKYYGDCLTGSDVIMPIHFDSQNRLWIGKNGHGIICVDFKSNVSHIFPAKKISNGIVRAITEDKNHRMWIGTEKGITIINPDNSVEILQHKFQDANSLSDNAIYCILCDSYQNMWVGSYFGGVDVLLRNNSQFQLFEPGNGLNNMKSRVARGMVETSPGIFWIATEDGGINIYNSITGTFSVFNGIPNMGTNVHTLYYDSKSHELWIGTRFNGLFRYNLITKSIHKYFCSNGLSSEGVFYITKQHNHRMWVATMQGLKWYDPTKDYFVSTNNRQLNNAFVYTLYADHHDNLWIGTTSYGVFRIDAKSGKITNIRKSSKSGLMDNYIICIFQDSKNTIWIGTNNNGLQYINKKTGHIESFDKEILLSKCTICSITEDKNRCLWISTSQGLYRYNLNKKSIVRFNSENGLPINQFNYTSSLMTSKGNILLGTINGLISFNPLNIKSKNGPFSVHLKQLIINNQPIDAASDNSPLENELDDTKKITLSFSQARSFSIEYGVIMPGNTASIEYQIWVEGIDRGWRNVGNERKFFGYNLQPGKYYLHVRANNSNEGWEKCEIKTIEIVVSPPFYRSIWAYLFYLIILATAVWFTYHLFAIRIKEKNAVKIANMEKDKIEEIDKIKSNFFTTVSHELKTPLSLIVAPLKSISRQELNDESQKHLDMAINNTQKMEGLINELVTFNKIETDNFPFYIQKGNPLEFIELTAMSFKGAFTEKCISFNILCENNGEEVWFSPSYTERIVNNLLSNALKFTPENGKVNVKAHITSLENDPYTYLCIKVSDTGIGIAKEEQKNIFNRYYQTKRGHNVNNSGWGIGLALVKRLVDIQRGRISVQSELNQGSTFTVLLNVSENAFDAKNRITNDKEIIPVNQYKFTTSAIHIDGYSSVDGDVATSDDKHSILIVDDNTDMLGFLKNYFSKNYNVYTAVNGREALELAQTEALELVISDVMMPEMDGIELCRRLKQDMATSHLPVILLTAKNEPVDIVSGYESGAEAYVSKPFDPNILELQIKNIIQLIKNRQDEIVKAKETDIDSTSLSKLDKEFIHKINLLVEQNLNNEDFDILDITQSMGVSRSLLHTKMKNLMNISMGNYIRMKRLDKACEMLKEGYNVSETAYSTGFSDPNYFSKAFKKYKGISPTEYIEKVKI